MNDLTKSLLTYSSILTLSVVVGVKATISLTSSFNQINDVNKIKSEVSKNKDSIDYKSKMQGELNALATQIRFIQKGVKSYSEMEILGHLGDVLSNYPDVKFVDSRYVNSKNIVLGDSSINSSNNTVNIVKSDVVQPTEENKINVVAPMPTPSVVTPTPSPNIATTEDSPTTTDVDTTTIDAPSVSEFKYDDVIEFESVYDTNFNAVLIELSSSNTMQLIQVIEDFEKLDVHYDYVNLSTVTDEPTITLVVNLSGGVK